MNGFVRETMSQNLIFGSGWHKDFLQQNFIHIVCGKKNRGGDFLAATFQEVGIVLMRPK